MRSFTRCGSKFHGYVAFHGGGGEFGVREAVGFEFLFQRFGGPLHLHAVQGQQIGHLLPRRGHQVAQRHLRFDGGIDLVVDAGLQVVRSQPV